MIATLILLVLSLPSLLCVLGLARALRQSPTRASRDEWITVLKPLRGADAELERNLRSFFEQDYERYEIVFGIEGAEDCALSLVRRLCHEYPHIQTRIVVHGGDSGLNPKVANLRAMVRAASHDIVVISDSNVRVGRDYLRDSQRALQARGVGLVTHLVTGTGEASLGAALDNLHLNTLIAGALATAASLFGHAAVVGKSMMFRRSVIEPLGGLVSVANVLAEDYVIGRMVDAAGYRVVLLPTPVRNVSTHLSVAAFVDRHVRWNMIRVRMQPLLYLLEPVCSPLCVALLAPLAGLPLVPVLVWAVALTLLRDALLIGLLRGRRGLLRALLLIPPRDALLLYAWGVAFFRRHVQWRGHRVRVSAGTRLYAEPQVARAQ